MELMIHMKIKKILLLFILVIGIFLFTACKNDEEKNYKLIRCTREAESAESDNVSIKLSYEVYYQDDYVKKVIATDKVTSSDSSILNQYTESYEKIYSAYDGLDHFSNKITVTKNTMTSVTEIDYAHIDTEKLLKIEGSDDNVIDENGRVPLKDFISFYEKYGAECDT